MARTTAFTKRALITKANRTIVMTTAIAAFVIVFCGVASRTLIAQASYQNKVISAKRKALATLKNDYSTSTALVSSYKNFVNTPQNLIGGNPAGLSGDKDGDNAKIILDALPSKYDYPALATSLEKLVFNQGLKFKSLSGTDEELAQSMAEASGQSTEPVAMPFQLEVAGSYDAVRGFVGILELSIRPFQVTKLDLSGSEGAMSVLIGGQSYYKAASGLKIEEKVLK